MTLETTRSTVRFVPNLYPSWLEIPVSDLERATAFYRAVFGLSDTPLYDDPPARIVVLRASEKSVKQPGVSLVQSPLHTPSEGGVVVNFHVGDHATLMQTQQRTLEHDGAAVTDVVDTGDGVRYMTLRDCEGNRFTISSYEALEFG
jgi:predicted enzyme related to lactoylglutathione lyase